MTKEEQTPSLNHITRCKVQAKRMWQKVCRGRSVIVFRDVVNGYLKAKVPGLNLTQLAWSLLLMPNALTNKANEKNHPKQNPGSAPSLIDAPVTRNCFSVISLLLSLVQQTSRCICICRVEHPFSIPWSARRQRR